MMTAFSVGVSGMQSMQKSVDLHSSNVANANTPGYRRRDVNHQEVFNGGVTTQVSHRFNQATAQRLSSLAGDVSQAGAKATALQETSGIIDQATTSMTDAQSALNELLYRASLTPNEPGLRDRIAQQANAISSQASDALSTVDGQLTFMTRDIAGTEASAKVKMNELVELNKEAFRTGESPELRDRQAQVGRELAELVGGEVRFEKNGSASFMLNNSLLVSDDHAADLPATTGGKLGGLNEALTEVQGYRADMAGHVATFASQFNSLNATGLDASGNPGGALFNFNGDKLSFVGSAAGLSLQSATAGAASPLQAMADASTLGLDFVSVTTAVASSATAAQSISGTKSSGLQLADENQQSAEGVDIDQEMVALKIAQRIYEANAKVIQTADSMLGTLLSIRA